MIFIDAHDFCSSVMDFGAWMLNDGFAASTRIETFARFQIGFSASADFHRISSMFIEAYGFSLNSMIFINLHGFSWIADWLAC